MLLKNDKTFQFLSSIYLAILLLLVLMISLGLGTLLESHYHAEFAQHYIYQSPWFLILLSLLFLNILCATLSRIPFQKKHIGFVITHIGLLTILIGGFVTSFYGTEGKIEIEEGQKLKSFQTNSLVVKLNDEQFDIRSIDGNKAKLEILEFLPFSQVEYQVLESQNIIDGAAIGFILKSSIIQVNDFLHVTDKPEINFGPMKIVIENTNQSEKNISQRIEFYDEKTKNILKSWDIQKQNTIDFQGYHFQVLQILKNATVMKSKLMEGQIVNPAVVLQITNTKAGQIGKEYLFATNPDFSIQKIKLNGFKIHYFSDQIGNHSNSDKKIKVFVLDPKTIRAEVFKGQELLDSKILSSGQKLQLPWMDMHFIVGDVLQHAHFVKNIVSAELKSASQQLPGPAVKVKFQDQEYWLTENTPNSAGLSLQRKTLDLPFSMTLLQFQKIDYHGSSKVREFKNKVLINENQIYDISMNEPLSLFGYKILQSSYRLLPSGKYISILNVTMDPGAILKYIGSIVLAIGIILHTLIRSRMWLFKNGKE